MLVVGGQRLDPTAPEGEVLVERARGEERIEPVGELDQPERAEDDANRGPVARRRGRLRHGLGSFRGCR